MRDKSLGECADPRICEPFTGQVEDKLWKVEYGEPQRIEVEDSALLLYLAAVGIINLCWRSDTLPRMSIRNVEHQGS